MGMSLKVKEQLHPIMSTNNNHHFYGLSRDGNNNRVRKHKSSDIINAGSNLIGNDQTSESIV